MPPPTVVEDIRDVQFESQKRKQTKTKTNKIKQTKEQQRKNLGESQHDLW